MSIRTFIRIRLTHSFTLDDVIQALRAGRSPIVSTEQGAGAGFGSEDLLWTPAARRPSPRDPQKRYFTRAATVRGGMTWVPPNTERML